MHKDIKDIRDIEKEVNIDLKIEDYNSLSDDSAMDESEDDDCGDVSPVAISLELAQPVDAQTDKIFKPKPKLGSSITGNVKDFNVEELKRFLKRISTNDTNFIITKEYGKDGKNPHLHFYIEHTTLQIDTVRKNLRTDPYFKKLKGKTAGGDHKYNMKYIQEMIQFYYIFKEVPLQKIDENVISEGFQISRELVEEYQRMYIRCLEHKKLSASNKFFFWLTAKKLSHSVLRDRKKLMRQFLNYTIEKNLSIINYGTQDKFINYVLARTNREDIERAWDDRIDRDYYQI